MSSPLTDVFDFRQLGEEPLLVLSSKTLGELLRQHEVVHGDYQATNVWRLGCHQLELCLRREKDGQAQSSCKRKRRSSETLHLLQFSLLVAEVVELTAGSDIGYVLPQRKSRTSRRPKGAGWRQIGWGRGPIWTLISETLLLCPWLLPLLPLDLSIDRNITVFLVEDCCKIEKKKKSKTLDRMLHCSWKDGQSLV